MIVSKPRHRGKFVSGFLIEICVTDADIGGAMADAEISEPRRIIGADRDVTHPINHPIVHAVVPPQRGLRIEIGETIPS